VRRRGADGPAIGRHVAEEVHERIEPCRVLPARGIGQFYCRFGPAPPVRCVPRSPRRISYRSFDGSPR
jgi:hypothetical protein